MEREKHCAPRHIKKLKSLTDKLIASRKTYVPDVAKEDSKLTFVRPLECLDRNQNCCANKDQ